MVEHDGTSHQPLDCILSATVIEVPVTEKLGFLSSTAKRLIPLASLASPIIFNAMIREITELSTIIFVGRCGDVVLIGAATLGNMMCNITGQLTVDCSVLLLTVSIHVDLKEILIQPISLR
jgi:hypothetical protein